MSTKILTNLSDENQNLQKQMGCMNGIFQLFDRHHFLTGRRLGSHHNKKQLPGNNLNVEQACGKEKDMRRNQEIVYEKHRTSTESSRSSSSSSFSSADHNTSSKPSRTSSRRHSFAESLPQTIPAKHHECPIPLGRQSPDLRDVVKDAMHREARGISIKMVAKEEGKNHVMKHIDSPRPLHNPKSWKPSVAGSDGSTQSQAKYREASRSAKEEMDTSVRQRQKDPPRFSYDGRESREATRSFIKLKELPRLSLDSRDTRGRQAFDLTPTSLLRGSGGEGGVYDQATEPSSNKCSTVIAKLMGLEPFPDHPFTDKSITTTSDGDSITRSSLSADLNRANNIPLSPRLQKDHVSQGSSKSNFLKKIPANSRLPLEQAPWRQQNANLEPHNLAVKNKISPAKGSLTSSTIYGQIEKRITDLEFKGSGKDLRALKQILEAMQKTRIRLENQQEEVDLESQTSRCSLEYSSGNHPMRSSSPVVTTNKSTSPRKLHVQDGKSKGVDSMHNRIGRDQRQVRGNPQQSGRISPNDEKKIKGRILNTVQLSKETRTKEQNSTVPTKSSGAISPRTRQKEHMLERKNQNSPLSNFPMARAQSSSPTRKPNVKSSYPQGDDRKYKLDRELRASFHQDDAASLQSESNNSSASHMDTDFTSTYSYENECKQQGGYKNRDLALRLKNNTPTAELVIPTAEQPSPVSVLDASFYREDSPSPVKKIPTPFNDDNSMEADEADWSPGILDQSRETRMPNLSVELYKKKMEEIRSLVHKLDELNRVSHEATIDIESISDKTNPDRRYITKILLASGLLKDISFLSNPVQLHSNGHVINPKLFHVLEQTEGQNEFSGNTGHMKANQKIQRKIVFDTVNEILARKLCAERDIPLGLTSVSSIELLKEIHVEVERLQKLSYSSNDEDEDHDHYQVLGIFEADMDHQSQSWKDYQGEMPSLVLDIERLIFKDLITEAINDGITGQQNRPKHSKKLFGD
ncbi:hypothetical protein LIER_37850 [Lithospermum erythrorhizon]|uniref:DUF4378 domain-containing protein n=1 Tax=Lithospermum erythrorhizon TaxID=34254 RepID=A0AAV3PUD0_LITER